MRQPAGATDSTTRTKHSLVWICHLPILTSAIMKVTSHSTKSCECSKLIYNEMFPFSAFYCRFFGFPKRDRRLLYLFNFHSIILNTQWEVSQCRAFSLRGLCGRRGWEPANGTGDSTQNLIILPLFVWRRRYHLVCSHSRCTRWKCFDWQIMNPPWFLSLNIILRAPQCGIMVLQLQNQHRFHAGCWFEYARRQKRDCGSESFCVKANDIFLWFPCRLLTMRRNDNMIDI